MSSGAVEQPVERPQLGGTPDLPAERPHLTKQDGASAGASTPVGRRAGAPRWNGNYAGSATGGCTVGLATLTGRELQVARLIADRRTNSQIAAELYLAPKTVETHVRTLFGKLGVSSRVEIARGVEHADRAAR